MFCRKCGNQLPDTAKFCPKCGTPVKRVDEQPLGMINVSQGVNEAPEIIQQASVNETPVDNMNTEDIGGLADKIMEMTDTNMNSTGEGEAVETKNQAPMMDAPVNQMPNMQDQQMLYQGQQMPNQQMPYQGQQMQNQQMTYQANPMQNMAAAPVKKAKAAKAPKPAKTPKPTGEKNSNNKIIITVMGLVIVCLIVVIALLFSKDFFNKDKSDSANSQVTTVSDDNNTSSKSNKNKDKETESSTEAETESTDNSEYVIADSDTRLLTKEDLVGLTQEELRIARNELYARHGRKFNDEALQSYFDSKSWYKGTIEPNDFTDDMLTETELKNKDTIVSYEEEMNYR
ncbi:YARHG domain-containing protein [Lachnospira multipara]|uniref:Zinc-ribbon domain-containing protein n=1 Tax=Lachnospira multipara TaxID=28051 RepID=A0A1H5RRU6_9FIRM|nr:YARHG domain-containing protein [Lachnospira multipara]SEF41035.1 zinc-ribbon domain-containing protein [Lachnospira multipara]